MCGTKHVIKRLYIRNFIRICLLSLSGARVKNRLRVLRYNAFRNDDLILAPKIV